MLTAEIKINGCMIGHIYIVNEGELGTSGIYNYSWEYYKPGSDSPQRVVMSGHTSHTRGEGALTLIKKVVDIVNRKEKALKKKGK